METIDWAIQGACGILCAFLLIEWWKDDERIAKLALYLIFAVGAVGFGFCIYWMGRTTGINDQFTADNAAVLAEWKPRVTTLPTVLGKAGIIDKGISEMAFGRASLSQVRSGFMSSRSYLFLFTLWMVVNFVAAVRPPARRRANPGTEPKPRAED